MEHTVEQSTPPPANDKRNGKSVAFRPPHSSNGPVAPSPVQTKILSRKPTPFNADLAETIRRSGLDSLIPDRERPPAADTNGNADNPSNTTTDSATATELAADVDPVATQQSQPMPDDPLQPLATQVSEPINGTSDSTQASTAETSRLN